MSNQAVIIQGTIGPDGTLAVVDKVPLPAGRVRVIVEPLPESQERGRTLPEILEQVRKDQAARGFSGRSRAEIDAELAALAAEDEEEERRWREIHSHTQHPLPPETND